MIRSNPFQSAWTYFTAGEKTLWCLSVALVLGMFLLFDRQNYLSLAASLVGVTSLIFNAKANPLGQALMVLFSLLYGVISFGFAYYGEMLTYLGMTAPMSLFALASWLRNPYQGNRGQVKIHKLRRREALAMLVWAVPVTIFFYFVLRAFHTANLIPSTVSVTTSFLAVYLTCKRSPWFALAYAANDLVLIVLWAAAALSDRAYLSVAACFLVFLANDVYTYVSWRRLQALQQGAWT